MAGFAKGMATTSGWALALCDCRTRIQQYRTLHRSRTMTMAAAAGSCGDVHDRIEESIAHDSADGNDSCYSFESLIVFLSFVDAAVHRTSKLQRGYGRRPKAIKLHANRKDTMGVLVLKRYMFRRGCVWKCEHVRWTP